MIITLDANIPQENSFTPRNEFQSDVISENSSVKVKFRLNNPLPVKEVTIFQVMGMDEFNENTPYIRIGILENKLYITCKDKDGVNHYTKMTGYDQGKLRVFEASIFNTYIQIIHYDLKTNEVKGIWKFERPFVKYKYKCGLYSQVDEGYYELDLVNFTMKTLN